MLPAGSFGKFKVMNTLLEAMLEAPDLVKTMESAYEVLDQERQRRLRFYDEVAPHQKAEFINGRVIMHSPAKHRHNVATSRLSHLLLACVDANDLGEVILEKGMVALTRNDYEPDVCFFRREVADTFPDDLMLYPAPDFVAEVLSPSTERTDRRIKMRDYAAHGINEYWIIDPELHSVEQYSLQRAEYQLLGTWKADNPVTSTAVAGFHIPVRAIFEREASRAALAHLSISNIG